MILGRPWYDAVLLAFIGIFFVVELFLLFRNSRLGWAMTAKCLMLSLTFFFALLSPLLPADLANVLVGIIRVGMFAALGWVIYELIRLRVEGKSVIVGATGNVTVIEGVRYFPVADFIKGGGRRG